MVDSYYLANATIHSENINAETAYIEIDIPSIPKGYYPDEAGISLALHHNDWSPWNKNSDYSYIASSAFTENPKIVLFSNNEAIYGHAPNEDYGHEASKLVFSGISFSSSPWIEIKNIGTTVSRTIDYKLVGKDSSIYTIGNDSLKANEILRICKNQIDCDSIEKTFILPDFNWTDTGEVFLKKDSSMLSYIAWGGPGTRSSEAHERGLWEDESAFFPKEVEIDDFNASYTKNKFFRLISQKSATNIKNWFSFSSNDNPFIETITPRPILLSANKPVIKRIPGDHDVLFSWIPVDGIEEYRVIIRNQAQQIIYNQKTSSTSLTIPLQQGDYFWVVFGGDKYEIERCYVTLDNGCDIQNYENLSIEDANINTNIYKQHYIPKIAARRDTKMLNLGYLGNSYLYSWDRPNLDISYHEMHEDSRCWAIAIETLNHFYGGNLTQDEIVYKGKFLESDPLLSPFYKDGATFKDPITKELNGDVTRTMKWALHTSSLNYHEGSPTYAIVKNAIDNNKLIYASISNHAVIIYGYVGNADNYAFYYAFIDNEGHIGNSLDYDKPILEYAIPDVTYGDVEMTDYRIHMDSDNDGITNFEEEERFLTNPFLADTDSDGIEDKREIYNYTIAIKSDTHLSFNPYLPIVKGSDGQNHTNPIYSDFDKIYNIADLNMNNIFAENDPDNNGDGIEDGLKGEDGFINMDVPEDYTIFGREYVTINDGVKCYNTPTESNSYCSIAASDERKFSYNISYTPIIIGARAHVGEIDVRKKLSQIKFPGIISNPTIRNTATIHGNLNIFAIAKNISKIDSIKKELGDFNEASNTYLQLFDISDYLIAQHSSSIEGDVNLQYLEDWKKDFTYNYLCIMPQIPETSNKIVQRGEIFHLTNGDTFSTLRIESGATMIIEPGEMFIDKMLQIEPNSTILFAEPGKSAVLHTNGKIIWRQYNSEDETNFQYWTNVAKGFKLAHHSSQGFYIEGQWAGTIFAPKAKVIMGQVNKTIYGRILARDVVIHQYAKVYRVDFDPITSMQVAFSVSKKED